jgi:AraC-like DNA-binding protein
MTGLPAPLRFSTRKLPRGARRQAVTTLHERGLLPVVPLPDTTPAVELLKWRLPGASVLSARLAGVRQIGDPPADRTGDELFFGINIVGTSVARQRGQDVVIDAGAAVALGQDDGPFTVLRPTPSSMIGLRVPRPAVWDSSRRTGSRGVQLVPGNTPALHLLATYLRSLLDGAVPTDALADAVVDHLTALIALSLGATAAAAPGAERSVRAARLQAAKADIARHVTDPGLSPAAVAARHQISVRYLHRLFEDDTRTYSQHVLDQRLELVHRRLRSPHFAGHTITSLATDAGFTDLSYFNRTFRRRYGATPTDVRHVASG